MTIARRLGVLVAVPLAALLGLAGLVFYELSLVESRSRFVAESQIPALAIVGNVSRTFEQLRVHMRTHLLARTPEERARAMAAFDSADTDITRLLNRYRDSIPSDGTGRGLIEDYRQTSREWIAGAQAGDGAFGQGPPGRRCGDVPRRLPRADRRARLRGLEGTDCPPRVRGGSRRHGRRRCDRGLAPAHADRRAPGAPRRRCPRHPHVLAHCRTDSRARVVGGGHRGGRLRARRCRSPPPPTKPAAWPAQSTC